MFKLKQVQNMIEGFTIALSNLSRGSLGSRGSRESRQSRTSSSRHRREHERLGSKRPSEDDRDPIFDLRGHDGSGSHVAVQSGDIEMDSPYKGVDGKGDAIQVTKSVDQESLRW
jgi:hypothetical protein